ncbi:MAG TPA: hypothetical protein PLU10_02710 [Chitinophagaceae bacterium]|nr:hypothetical protein [Chitinophagaceae bacterium]
MIFNIDVHCHSSSKAFMSGVGQPTKNPYQFFEFDLSHPIYQLLRKPIERLSHIRLATQSNFDSLYEGGIRVAMVSLTPMEKAFTVLNQDQDTWLKQFIKNVLREPSNYQEGFVGSKAINALTGYHVNDIEGVKRLWYAIYHDLLKKEIKFLYDLKGELSPNKKYRLQFPADYSELVELSNNPENLCILLSVEGAHSFGENRVLPDIIDGRRNNHEKDTHNVLLAQEICKNIQDVKTNGQLRLHSVGLCHHFWNGLAGHCRSMDNLMSGILNQEEGLNAPLMDTGRMVLDEMARTDYNGKSAKPIVIDIKHMSPQARKDFYNYRSLKKDIKALPIFCSHTGVNMSFETLNEWIAYVKKNPKEKAGRKYEDGAYYLHEQSINLCREDLCQILDSKGLLGIQLDEKRIMGPFAFKELSKRSGEGKNDERKYVYAKCIWANIYAAIDELVLAGKNGKSAWDIFAIGSDFDGLINHLDSFGSAASMNGLKATMAYFLEEPEDIMLFWKDEKTQYTITVAQQTALQQGISHTELIQKLFQENAMKFLERTF